MLESSNYIQKALYRITINCMLEYDLKFLESEVLILSNFIAHLIHKFTYIVIVSLTLVNCIKKQSETYMRFDAI